MLLDDAVRSRAAFPQTAAPILNRRSLSADYPALAAALAPGQQLLDAGCGSGAMTLGMARAVAPARVVGVDASAELLAQARALHAGPSNLSFQQADIYALPFEAEFDVVVAARVLQWLADPQAAVRELARVLRPGGRLYLLDYQHHQAELQPAPPASMLHFRRQYLTWRAEAGFSNTLADHLPELLTAAGLADVQVTPQPEMTRRGDADFERRISLWGEVAATRGHQVVASGQLSETERAQAEREFAHWAQHEARQQTFALQSASASKPARPPR